MNSSTTNWLPLYQSTRYRAKDGNWYCTFVDALQHSGNHLTWDSAAILSILSFSYICGDRTLIKEIKRQPWLSEIGSGGEPILQAIPPHHRRWVSAKEAASELQKRLCDEALVACQGHRKIYLLLSGGLDSRVIAGIFGHLVREGMLPVKPVCVTWGLPDSRDVVYGRKVADILGFEWCYVDLEPCDLLNNMRISSEKLGAMVSAVHLHRMNWFENVDPNAIVIAATYGDMVGRAESSGAHLLELNYLKPINSFNLLEPSIFSSALRELSDDLQRLRERTPNQPKYVICEHETHAHYLRGKLAQTMNIINQSCTLYQMFTHPDVYSYMWSLHPAVRNDDIYAALLEQLEPKLARLPWARTNRALKGKTEGADSSLNPHFNQYDDWIASSLFDNISQSIGTDWLAGTGLFNTSQVRQLSESVNRKAIDLRYVDAYEIFIWLASLKGFMEWCEQLNIQIAPEQSDSATVAFAPIYAKPVSKLRATYRSLPPLYRLVKFLRRRYYRVISVFKYPPEYEKS